MHRLNEYLHTEKHIYMEMMSGDIYIIIIGKKKGCIGNIQKSTFLHYNCKQEHNLLHYNIKSMVSSLMADHFIGVCTSTGQPASISFGKGTGRERASATGLLH